MNENQTVPKRYFRVLLTTHARISFGKSLINVNIGTNKVRVQVEDLFLRPDTDTSPILIGTQLSIDVEANNISEAIALAMESVKEIIDVFAFIERAAIEDPKIEVAIEMTPDIPEREFVQFAYDIPVPLPFRTTFDIKEFQRLSNAFQKTNSHNRIIRAMNWFRRSLLTADPIDRFLYVWQGIEALNPVLMEKFKIPSETKRCSECGAEQKIPTTAGIRWFFHNHHHNGEKTYKYCRDLRTELTHGLTDYHELERRAIELLKDAEEMLLQAVYLIWDIESPKSKKFPSVLREISPSLIILEATLECLEPTQLFPGGQYPHFEVSHDIVATGIDLTSTKGNTYLKNCCGCKAKVKRIRMAGQEKGIKGEISIT